jgi:HAD superfamily hydrolase (TIGR01490 family)
MAGSAAFFDLDKTVIAKSSTLAFSRPLHHAGFLSRRMLMKAGMAQLFYVIFGADQKQLERGRDQMLTLTRGWRKAELERLVTETLEEVAAPLVYAEALFLIDEHLRQDRRVVIVSASPEEIVAPIARFFGVNEVIATRNKTDADGRFVGELEQYVQGSGKVDAIARYAAAEDIDLAASYAYSDSATDIPMLEMVGHPVAVNPDRDLKEHAETEEWPILEFTRQVAPADRLVQRNPILSGAALAGAAALVAFLLARRRNNG